MWVRCGHRDHHRGAKQTPAETHTLTREVKGVFEPTEQPQRQHPAQTWQSVIRTLAL